MKRPSSVVEEKRDTPPARQVSPTYRFDKPGLSDPETSIPILPVQTKLPGPAWDPLTGPPARPSSSGCILYQNADRSVIVLDIPRSLEEAQFLAGSELPARRRRIYSSEPISVPYNLPEPRDVDARQMARPPAELLHDLMTGESIRAALDELRRDYSGPACLPRLVCPVDLPPETPSGRRRRRTYTAESVSVSAETTEPEGVNVQQRTGPGSELARDSATGWPSGSAAPPMPTPLPFIPEGACVLNGPISTERRAIRGVMTPCSLDLIVLDPPWPNASARRSSQADYRTCTTMYEAVQLLDTVPVGNYLRPGGLVAMWLTNRPNIVPELVNSGVIDLWGVDIVAEWVWVKVTSAGEPVFPLDGWYRKPWERLLIGARRPIHAGEEEELKRRGKIVVDRRVIVAVPDVHSRKPNLRAVFDDLLPAGYSAMEVFARNLTAGWCGMGIEVLKFQEHEWWGQEEEIGLEGGNEMSPGGGNEEGPAGGYKKGPGGAGDVSPERGGKGPNGASPTRDNEGEGGRVELGSEGEGGVDTNSGAEAARMVLPLRQRPRG